MVVSLSSRRHLIAQFLKREVVGRYRGAYLGLAWAILNPLATLAVYSFVFGYVFKSRFDNGTVGGTAGFVLNLFCGLIVYGVFSGTLSRATELLLENRNLVKRVVFPLEALPVAVMGGNLVQGAMALGILFAALLAASGSVSPTMWAFPAVLIPLCALTLGLAWILSSIGVFIRDVGQVVTVGLQLLLFASPVLYPLSFVPERFQLIVRLNPLVTILENSRRTLISGQMPEWGWLAATTLACLIILQAGFVCFMKSKRVFADVL
jgi:lipopolysaccharide transport system permease protein